MSTSPLTSLAALALLRSLVKGRIIWISFCRSCAFPSVLYLNKWGYFSEKQCYEFSQFIFTGFDFPNCSDLDLLCVSIFLTILTFEICEPPFDLKYRYPVVVVLVPYMFPPS